MTPQNENLQLLAWAGRKIQQAQDEKAYCTVTVHMKDGKIFKIDRNDSFVPPSPGTLYKQTGG